MKLRLFAIITLLFPFIGCNGAEPETPGSPSGEAPEPMVVYEVNPRLFQKGASFDKIAERLGDIKKLGVDVLWLMPINEPGKLKSVNSPYCIKDFKKVNPDYGTVNDLKELVTKAHSMGMKVILDWIANHTSWDCEWINDKSWYTQDAYGNIIDPPGFNWTDVADLNYNNEDMRAAMKDAILYWVKEVGIDGYRFDHVDGVPNSFWAEINEELKKVDPDMILLAETSNVSITDYGFTSVYSWNFGSKVKQVFNGKAKPADLATQYKSENEKLAEGTRIMRYITNHDESSQKSPVTEFQTKEAALAGFVVTSLMTDMPLIYSSQETGYARSLNFFNFINFDWKADPAYTAAYENYMKAYKASASLRAGDPILYNVANTVAIYYSAGKKGFLALVNITAKDITVKAPTALAKKSAKDLMTGDNLKLDSSLKIGPYGYLLLEVK